MVFKKLKLIFAIAFVVLAFLSYAYLRHTWNHSLLETSEQALLIAETSEIALDGEMLKQLRAIPEDLGTIAYESVKRRLVELAKVDEKIRFAYLYVQRDGKIYFLADSEPDKSPAYSSPGQEYVEASNEYFQPFTTNQFLITDPVTDRWGTWISVLMPIKDSVTGRTKAVFAIDYPAVNWSDEAIYNTRQAGLIVLILFLLLTASYLLIRSTIKLKVSEEQFRSYVENSPSAVLVCDEQGRYVSVNPAVSAITGYSEEELLKFNIYDLFTPQSQKIAKDLFRDVAKLGRTEAKEMEFKHKDGHIGIWFLEAVQLSPTRFMGFATDITRLKRSEEVMKKTLKDSERLNNLMVGRELEMIKLKQELADLKTKNSNESQK